MSSKLQKIIAHYEEERAQLVALLAECIAESDYKLAHAHSKALRLLNQQLQTYYNLADPLHDEKEKARRHIDYLKNAASKITSKAILTYYDEMLMEAQQQLDKLSHAVENNASESKKTILSEILDKLLKDKIEKFMLVIDEAAVIYCTV